MGTASVQIPPAITAIPAIRLSITCLAKRRSCAAMAPIRTMAGSVPSPNAAMMAAPDNASPDTAAVTNKV
ncbi:MAG: hypothetical protein SVU69_01570 [Pseudomonadota bacterium]|nr:hypothetical protein [Pseudomonadota bacterium]